MELKRLMKETAITDYYPIPRGLLGRSLPFSSMLLYGLLLDRATLSQKNGYENAEGWVYVVYPVLEAAEVLGISSTSVKKGMKQLEEAGLIRRVRRSRKEANRIYLLLPEDSVSETTRESRRATKRSVNGQNSACRRERKVPPSNLNKQQDGNNCYLHKQEESL